MKIFVPVAIIAIVVVAFFMHTPKLIPMTDTPSFKNSAQARGDSIVFYYCADLPTPCHDIQYELRLLGGQVSVNAILIRENGVCTEAVTEKCKGARFGPLAPGNYSFKIDGVISDSLFVEVG